jgi:hypothetical protein
MPADIRLRVGIAVDSNPAAVMAPIEQAVKRTRKSVEADMRAAGKAVEKETKAGLTSAERSWKQHERDIERMANQILKDEEKTLKASAKAADQAERQKTASAKREAAERIREAKREAQERSRAMAKATHEIERQKQREARTLGGSGGGGRQRSRGVNIGAITSSLAGYGGSAVSAAAGLAREFMGGMGVDTDLSSHIAQAQQQQILSTQISNAGYVPGTQLVDPKDILRGARQVGNETGTDATEALQALQAFVSKTGDLDTGRRTLKDMAILSKATGSNLSDMSDAAAEVTNNLEGVPDKAGVTSKIMQQIAGEGKLGAVEIKDLASQMAKLASASSRFQGGAVANIATLGVLAQESKLRGGSASATQAATAVTAFASTLGKGATLKNWRAMGITPYADKGNTTLSDPMSIIKAALRATNGNQEKLNKLFPSEQAKRGVYGFANVFNEAGGGAKGLAAVDEEFKRLSEAMLANEEVQRAYAARMKDSDSSVTTFNNHMTEVAGQLASAVLPAFEGLAPRVVAATTSFADMVSELTGQNRKDAIETLDKLPSGAGDVSLLEKTKAEGESWDPATGVAGGHRTTVYSREQIEVMKANAQKRLVAMTELQAQIGNESRDASLKEQMARDPTVRMKDWAMKQMLGSDYETNEEGAKRLRGQAASDTLKLAGAQVDQAQTNTKLDSVEQAVRAGTADIVSAIKASGSGGPASADQGARAKANTET